MELHTRAGRNLKLLLEKMPSKKKNSSPIACKECLVSYSMVFKCADYSPNFLSTHKEKPEKSQYLPGRSHSKKDTIEWTLC
jgi:hypothetical protein